MTKGQGVVAVLLVAVAVLLLTGCVAPPWQAYAGEKLPNDQTALIESRRISFFRSDTVRRFVSVVGEEIQQPTLRWVNPDSSGYRPIRVLPGRHDLVIESGRPVWMPPGFFLYGQGHVIIDAEAGKTYNVQYRWIGDPEYIWVLDETGSVVAGEKPPGK